MKKSPIKTGNEGLKTTHNSMYKGKYKQNSKTPTKSPIQKPSTLYIKTPPKQSAKNKEISKTQGEGQSSKKNKLFPISQASDQSQESLKLNGLKQNVSFILQDKSYDKKKDDDFQFDQRSPKFETSSFMRSQKQYNVSLAGSSKPENSQPHHNTQNKKSLSKQNTSFSPLKARHEFESEEEIDQWLAANLKKTNNVSIKKISEQFKNLIEEPLKIQEELSKSLHPIQRCLTHNTPFSLYCTIDRQLLCVSCIYAQKTHKNHQILPLGKSQKQMKEDMEGFRNRVDTTLAQSESLIRQASLNLIKIEKEYPVLLKSIDSYYTSIHAMIDQKKAEQIEYVESLREEYKKQLKTINGLLNKISNRFYAKLKQIERHSKIVTQEVYQAKNQNKLQDLNQSFRPDSSEIMLNSILKHRCEYEILSRFHKILTNNSDSLFEERKTFSINLQNFESVINLIKYKLAIVVPVMKKDESKKPWIVQLLGEEGAKQLRAGNINVNVGVHEKNEMNASNQEDHFMNQRQNKALVHKKGFSTSPQVPKGISRRFL